MPKKTSTEQRVENFRELLKDSPGYTDGCYMFNSREKIHLQLLGKVKKPQSRILPFQKIGEALRTHLCRENVWNVLSNDAEMIDEVLVPYTFRHRYAKAFNAGGIPLTSIAADMVHTTEVHHQSYARFIPDGTAYLYAKRNARVA